MSCDNNTNGTTGCGCKSGCACCKVNRVLSVILMLVKVVLFWSIALVFWDVHSGFKQAEQAYANTQQASGFQAPAVTGTQAKD